MSEHRRARFSAPEERSERADERLREEEVSLSERRWARFSAPEERSERRDERLREERMKQ